MPKRHPDQEALASFVQGELSSAENLKHAWHLLHCCHCRVHTEQIPGGRLVLSALFASLETPSRSEEPRGTTGEYGEILDRSYGLALEHESEFRQDRDRAPALLAELQRHPASRQRFLITNTSRFHNWALVELLLERSAAAWFVDAGRSEALAELALVVVGCLRPGHYSAPLLADLAAGCFVHLANARRIGSNHAGAEAAFEQADEHLGRGTSDPLERAHYLYFLSVLRRDQRRFDEATSLMEQAIKAYRRAGDLHEAGKVMVTLANVAKNQGEPERAIEILRQALLCIDLSREPRLALITRHNLISYLAEADRFMEARSLLARSRELYKRHADPLTGHRYLWLQGQIAYGLGQNVQAERLLERARHAFVALGMSYDAALVSLDLALVYASERRNAEMKELAAEVLPIFQSLDIHREAMAALLVFARAAQAERVTVALVRQLCTRLRREERNVAGKPWPTSGEPAHQEPGR